MPMYNYHCLDCGTAFTATIAYAELDEALPKCPDCGSTNCQRGLSNVNMALGNTEEPFHLTHEHVQAAAGMTGLMQGGGHDHGGGCACGGSCDCTH